jgi:rubredoxin/uncharacterized membrane protein
MKKWKCGICGFIHEGQEPPKECPVCKAKEENFSEMKSKAVENGEAAAAGVKPESASFAVAASPAKSKRWRCLVCGYVHEGEAPPAHCPVCKAPAAQFAELDAKGNLMKNDGIARKPGIITRILLGLHMHPILVHFPNGILPMVVLFMAGSVFLSYDTFADKSTFYSLIFVLITMPFVLASGFLEWKGRYHGARTVLFAIKVFCGFLALICLAILVAWRAFFDQEVLLPNSPYRLIYFIVAAVLLGAVAVAGHLGGHLVFKNRGR